MWVGGTVVKETTRHVILRTDEGVEISVLKSEFAPDVADIADLPLLTLESVDRLIEYRKNCGEYVTKVGVLGIIISEPAWVSLAEMGPIDGRDIVLFSPNSEILRCILAAQNLPRIRLDKILSHLTLIHTVCPGMSYRVHLGQGRARIEALNVYDQVLSDQACQGLCFSDDPEMNESAKRIMAAIVALEQCRDEESLCSLLQIDENVLRVFFTYRPQMHQGRLIHVPHADPAGIRPALAATLRARLAAWLAEQQQDPCVNSSCTVTVGCASLTPWLNREAHFFETCLDMTLPTAKMAAKDLVQLDFSTFSSSSDPLVASLFASKGPLPSRIRRRQRFTVGNEEKKASQISTPLVIFTSVCADLIDLARFAKGIRPYALRMDREFYANRYSELAPRVEHIFLTEDEFSNLEITRKKDAIDLIANRLRTFLASKKLTTTASVPPLPEFSSPMLAFLTAWARQPKLTVHVPATASLLAAKLAAAAEPPVCACGAAQRDELIELLNLVIMTRNWDDGRLMGRIDILAQQIKQGTSAAPTAPGTPFCQESA